MQESDHQLHRIFEILGTPSVASINKLSHPTVKRCLLQLSRQSPKQPAGTRELTTCCLLLAHCSLLRLPSCQPTPTRFCTLLRFNTRQNANQLACG